ncbi:MAG: DUF6702 family protein [Chitinophagales bacterium]|nr:hypothetical protein [Bacteroidota bacterium]MCB9043424.1 hypothetical protein [Chitinophagales bacterium]
MKKIVFSAKYLCILVLFFLLGNAKAADFHEFYVSLFEINYNTARQRVEISIRVFTEDAENALSCFSGEDISWYTHKAAADSVVQQYLAEKLTFTENKTKIAYTYLGSETRDDQTWLYVEIDKIPESEWNISCSFFTEMWNNQINIFYIRENQENRESIYLSRNKTTASFSF